MIKVGFLLNFTVEYKGGINYLKNLFYALKKHHSDDIEIILFVPENIDVLYEDLFSPYTTVIRTKILQRKTVSWFLSRVCEKYLRFDPFVFYLLKKNKINCISHSNYVYPFNDIKTINWVPDFQYLHYPNLWPSKQLSYINKQHKDWILNSDAIVVSSYAAKNDLLSMYPNSANKVTVLHFVSQPEKNQNSNDTVFDSVKLGFKGDFFYLPNQFWNHKNHITVFKAVNALKKRGINILLVTTGSHNEFRDAAHYETLIQYVKDNVLEKNILFLGLIQYSQVFSLMQHSLSIINPSYFEGWSSTVEESKSINKRIILSDIPVHREQNPHKGIYFNPDDEVALATILERVWNKEITVDSDSSLENQPTLEMRTKDFSDKFYELIR